MKKVGPIRLSNTVLIPADRPAPAISDVCREAMKRQDMAKDKMHERAQFYQFRRGYVFPQWYVDREIARGNPLPKNYTIIEDSVRK
jgi:hypothetical protein